MSKLSLVFGLLTLVAYDGSAQNTGAPDSPLAADNKVVATNAVASRPYSAEQVAAGKAVFTDHCQVCHGENGVGETKQWQSVREDGTFPAPPLNGSAHTWHHNAKVLLGTIDRGGIPLGGRMPAFKTVLSDEQKTSVLAYIQSLWSEEIYQIWLKNNG